MACRSVLATGKWPRVLLKSILGSERLCEGAEAAQAPIAICKGIFLSDVVLECKAFGREKAGQMKAKANKIYKRTASYLELLRGKGGCEHGQGLGGLLLCPLHAVLQQRRQRGRLLSQGCLQSRQMVEFVLRQMEASSVP
jgi:hypothetical protein